MTSGFNQVIVVSLNQEGHQPVTGLVKMSGVCGKWNDQSDGNTLDDISFEAENGKLTAIVGPVGCGKTSVLNAILGELPIPNGKVKVVGRLGYEFW